MTYGYIHMDEVPQVGKTIKVWKVINNHSGTTIGRVSWYGAWRQYAFFPWPDTVYSAGCLKDVADFIGREMDGWRNRKKVAATTGEGS